MKKVEVYIERSEDGCFYAYAANPMILPYGLTGEGAHATGTSTFLYLSHS